MKYMFARKITKFEGYVIIEVEAENEVKATEMAMAEKGDLKFDKIQILELGDPVPMGPTSLKSKGKC